MEPALVCLFGIALDRFLGTRFRHRPLQYVDRLAQSVGEFCYGSPNLNRWLRLFLGVLTLLVIILPAAVLAQGFSSIPYLGSIVDLALLYLALGASSLKEQACALNKALDADDLSQAREILNQLVSRHIQAMDEESISLTTIEWLLKKGCEQVFGVLFWFVLAGAPGLVVYRLANILAARWGYPSPRYRYFGWTVARLNDLLGWVPVQLNALSYILLGKQALAWRCWWRQGLSRHSLTVESAIAAAAGALGLQLGGSVQYYQRIVHHPPLGDGLLPKGSDIHRALNMLYQALGLWVALILFAGGLSPVWSWGMKF